MRVLLSIVATCVFTVCSTADNCELTESFTCEDLFGPDGGHYPCVFGDPCEPTTVNGQIVSRCPSGNFESNTYPGRTIQGLRGAYMCETGNTQYSSSEVACTERRECNTEVDCEFNNCPDGVGAWDNFQGGFVFLATGNTCDVDCPF